MFSRMSDKSFVVHMAVVPASYMAICEIFGGLTTPGVWFVLYTVFAIAAGRYCYAKP